MGKKVKEQDNRVNVTSPLYSTSSKPNFPGGGFVTMSEADRERLLKRMKRFGLQ